MRTPPVLWAARVLWLLLPLGVGDLLTAALRGRPSPMPVLVAVTAWTVWAAGVGALFVALPVTLTVLRVLGPIPLVAGTVAALDRTPGPLGWAGLAGAAAAWVCTLTAEVGDTYVDGASYGDERRFTLRAPALVAWVAAPAVWVLTVGPLLAAVVVAGRRQWVAAGALAVLGGLTALFGSRVLHRLSGRWLVMVPAGVTVVDPLALSEPVLFAARGLVRVGPAHVGTTAHDLTAGAAGLVLELDVDPAVELVPSVGRGRTATPLTTGAVLVCPSRPGAVLGEAERRGLPVGRD